MARPAAPLNFGPLTLVAIRLGLAATVLYVVLRLRRLSFPWHRWGALAVLGLVNAGLPYFLFSWGEQRINSNLAAIYNATTPLWTVLLAWLFVRTERLSLGRSMGVVLGFAGVFYLFARNLTSTQHSISGELACVVAAMSYALGNMWARLRLRDIEPTALATGQLLFGTLWMLPLSLAFEHPWTMRPTMLAFGSLAVLSILGTGVAMLLYFGLLAQVGATRTSQVTYLLPIFGLLWGRLLGEPITSDLAVGLAIILLGSIVINGGLEWLLRQLRRGAGKPPEAV